MATSDAQLNVLWPMQLSFACISELSNQELVVWVLNMHKHSAIGLLVDFIFHSTHQEYKKCGHEG